MTKKLEIDITREAGEWPHSVDDLVRGALLRTFEHLEAAGPCEVSVVFADNNFVQNLNRQYRGKDKPTNVLSFPQIEGEALRGALGDIIMALETIHEEAARDHKFFDHHVTHLAVHGLLHLAGHDHENDGEAAAMEGLEARILESMGIKNPYEA